MWFNIPLNKVERQPITDYRLMLFTIFNSAALNHGLSEMKFQTDDEEMAELTDQVEHLNKIGFFK